MPPDASLPQLPTPDALLPPPPADQRHRTLLGGEFWRVIPAYAEIGPRTFEDHQWQAQHAITRVDRLFSTLRELVSDRFYQDVERGLARSPMSLRLTPYIVSLIDWEQPERDPLRRQFLPLASEQLPDHPRTYLDALHERASSPVEGLVHRYADRALFLTQDRCPVYCRYCTRSYAVGPDTDALDKLHVSGRDARWAQVLDYVRSTPQVEDVLISGGDAFSLRAEQLSALGEALLSIDHVRRIRIATKGLAVLPMKILTDYAWTRALVDLTQRGRKAHKQVMVHTHISHPREITAITERAVSLLFEEGVPVRNQHVLLRGINDDPDTLRLLVKRLGHLQIQPYYVLQHDMVRGVEDLRTALRTTIAMEKQTRGHTAGFHTPAFVIDTPGGGGKRDVHAYEHYDLTTGISVFRSPNVNPTARYVHFDPIDTLPEAGQALWADAALHPELVADALSKA